MTTLSRRLPFVAPTEKPAPFSRDEMRVFTASFWSEADEYVAGKLKNAPQCPSLSVIAPKCDCPKTHDSMFKKDHECNPKAVCCVRITLFPKGAPPHE